MKILLDLQYLQDETETSNETLPHRESIRDFFDVADVHDLYVLLNNSVSVRSVEIQRELFSRLGADKVKVIALFPWRRQQNELSIRRGLQYASEIYRNLVIDEVAPDVIDHGLLNTNPNEVAIRRVPPRGGPYINLAHWNGGDSQTLQRCGLNRLDAVLTSDHNVKQSLIDVLRLSPDQITVLAPPFNEVAALRPVPVFDFAEPGHTSRICVVLHGESPRPIHNFLQIYICLPAQIQWTHYIDVICNSAAQIDGCRRVARMFGLEDIVRPSISHPSGSGDMFDRCKLAIFLGSSSFVGYDANRALTRGVPALVGRNSYVGGVEPHNPIMFNVELHERSADVLRRALLEPAVRRELWIHGRGLYDGFFNRNYGAELLATYECQYERCRREGAAQYASLTKSRRLLFFSPLPPAASGVADYSLDLLASLSINFDIDCVVDQDHVELGNIEPLVRVFKSKVFDCPPSDYDAIIYNMGNSKFHHFMMMFMDEYPGVTILHDFYLGHLLAWAIHEGLISTMAIRNELYFSHGIAGLALQEGLSYETLSKSLPLSGFVFRKSRSVVVHSEHARELSRQFGEEAYSKTSVVPMIHPAIGQFEKSASRNKLGIPADALVVSSFGMLTPHKNCEDIFHAWTSIKLADFDRSLLIFVGDADGNYGRQLLTAIEAHPLRSRIKVTGRVEQEDFLHYLAASDIVVQLRSESRGETSKSMLDALTFGKALIINAHGSAKEWPKDAVRMISDPVDVGELAYAMEALAAQPAERDAIGSRGRDFVVQNHGPSVVVDMLGRVIAEAFHPKRAQAEVALRDISNLLLVKSVAPMAMRAELAKSLRTAFNQTKCKQLFVDVTVLADLDAHTGIQRVVKAIFQEIIENPPEGYRIEPVLIREGMPRYAQTFMNKYFGGIFADPSDEEWVTFHTGDHYIALDWVPDRYPDAAPWFSSFRALGGTVTTVVYDLLPLKRPEFFPEGTLPNFRRWTRACIQSSDRIACISRAVAADVKEFIRKERLDCEGLFVGAFPLGSDLRDMKLSEAAQRVDGFPALPVGKTLLMVGSLEPRKGHIQSIDAMRLLWAQGFQVNLVIVGRKGWRYDDILEAMYATEQLGKRLIWLSDTSDATLTELYRRSDGLLAASYDEGFGLPLIEASRFDLPVIARDIPVFREVCPHAAVFFSGVEASNLAEAVRGLLARVDRVTRNESRAPPPSWRDAAEQLLTMALQPAASAACKAEM